MKEMAAVILAAGKGTRMNSDLPKVLHTIAGRPMVEFVAEAAAGAGVEKCCVVVGHGAEQVRAALGPRYIYALQEKQLGTGHAMMQALPALTPLPAGLLVLCGDTPLLTAETLSSLREVFEQSQADCVVMTAVLTEGGSYGRIIRDEKGLVSAIVEARDATPEQLAICEINSGVYCFDSAALTEVISHIEKGNDQGEYYLTDAVAALRSRGYTVAAWPCPDPREIYGVNDPQQLEAVSEIIAQRDLSGQ